MNYDIAPIPTTYRGRNYRSRLEAKWACFFDLIGLEFEYEPFEIGGWNPDFLLKLPLDVFTGNHEVLVEVKPSQFITLELQAKMYEAVAGTKYKLLILKETPMDMHEGFSFGFNGLMPLPPDTKYFTFDFNGKKYPEFSACFIMEHETGGVSIIQVENPEAEDKHWTRYEYTEIQDLWDTACNTVMFLKPNVFNK